MEIRHAQLLQELKVGKLRNAYLLTGENQYIKEEIVSKITSLCIKPEFKDLDMNTLYGEEVGEFLIEKLYTIPMGSKKRLCIIKNAQKLPESYKKKIIDYLKKPSQNSILIMLTIQNSEFRIQNSEGLTICKCWNLRVSELHEWIIEFVQTKKSNIDKTAVELLIDLFGRDLSLLSTEIEKLVHLSRITKKDIIDMKCVGKEKSVFELTDSLGNKDYDGAARALKSLIEWNEKPERILAIIENHFSTLLKVKKHVLTKEVMNGQVQDKISKQIKHPAFVIRKCISQARNYTYEEIVDILSFFYNIDREVKSGIYDRDFLLEETLFNFHRLFGGGGQESNLPSVG